MRWSHIALLSLALLCACRRLADHEWVCMLMGGEWQVIELDVWHCPSDVQQLCYATGETRADASWCAL